jgi:putative membrane protein
LLLKGVHNMSEMREANILKGMLAGAVGGLVASWTMNEFQKVWAAAEKQITGGKQGQNGGQQSNEDAEDATMKTADRISEALQGRHLTKDENKKAGAVVHYAFGALMGAVYGASVEVNPAANALAGIPFGAILFAAADEVALPALGLSDKPAAYPLSTHLYGLVSHAVYGVTTETVRRIVRG